MNGNGSDLHSTLARALREHAPVTPDLEPHLRTVIAQAVGRPGRLIRARLAYAGATSHGMSPPCAARLATAVEYFHLASLLLDDLPCMDNAVERRGRPCPHLVHGEAAVVLTALALINRAYALIGFLLGEFPPAFRLPAQACMDSCLGSAGLVGGQASDLRFTAGPATARAAGRIALRKTGALFTLSLLLPAFVSAPDLREFRLLKSLCVYWGLAYQLADDLADATGPADCRRPNLARILGRPGAVLRLDRLRRRSAVVLERLQSSHPRWNYLAEYSTRLLPAELPPRAGLAA